MLIRPMQAFRPTHDVAHCVAALPYDVYNREEARKAVEGKPLSFLAIDRPETQLAPEIDMYADEVYEKGRALLKERIEDGTFIQEQTPGYFVYELTMEGQSQTGLVACCSIDEYDEGIIKKHENTLAAKEQDRIRHIDALDAQTGPIFLTYRGTTAIDEMIAGIKACEPLYDFVSSDDIAHRVWRVFDEPIVGALTQAFCDVPCAYIADGHHRCASAVKVGKARREAQATYTGNEEFNFFMSVLFPADQLRILPYNRVVHDLNSLSKEAFLQQIGTVFDILHTQEQVLEPIDKGALAMYLDGEWYGLGIKERYESDDPVAGLDVSILQDTVLGPILGIDDPRTSERIDFVGGIRGSEELERLVDSYTEYNKAHTENQLSVAFSLYPTGIGELLRVADANLLMPPKSTWFEPKLRSGLFIHSLL